MLKPYYQKELIEAGCDEAGRGCLAGPVVAAAVILPIKFRHKTLNDSKQLSKKLRDELELEIKKKALAWAVTEVSNEEIDEINILNASFRAMHLAVSKLQLKPEMLLIDGNRFTQYKDLLHQCIVKGDAKFYSIAAASVLAKTHRDRLMKKQSEVYPGYKWETNVGYPTLEHREGIRQLGITPLHRKSFQLLPIQFELFEE
ncbi:MAG: ribonuclease HII [Bacteroidetes bacterium]|nr:ribonuclease HII [Bacteroidota bacterium]MDA1119820.1 ribonuclease HII [Bacteroidota bacterium]